MAYGQLRKIERRLNVSSADDKAGVITQGEPTLTRFVSGSVFNGQLQMALERKAEGNLYSTVFEMFKFLTSREPTQFPISNHQFGHGVIVRVNCFQLRCSIPSRTIRGGYPMKQLGCANSRRRR